MSNGGLNQFDFGSIIALNGIIGGGRGGIKQIANYEERPNIGSSNILYITQDTSIAYYWDNITKEYKVVNSPNNKGYFIDLLALQTAFPVGQDGWYATLGSTDTVWTWDTNTNSWIDTDTKGQVSRVFSRTGDIVAEAGDYNASQVDYNNSISGLGAINVQEAIDEIVANNNIAFNIQGNYDATNNTPDLNTILGIGTAPTQRWIVNVAGTQNIAGIGLYAFTIGHSIVVNSTNDGYYVQSVYSDINDEDVSDLTTFSSKKIKQIQYKSTDYNIKRQDLNIRFIAMTINLNGIIQPLSLIDDGMEFVLSNDSQSLYNVLIAAPVGVVFLDTMNNTIILQPGDLISLSFYYDNSIIILNN